MQSFGTTVFLLLAVTGSNGGRFLSDKHYRLDCNGSPPQRYFSTPRSGDNGFHLRIEGAPEFYEPEREYVVTLQSTLPSSFRGFAIRSTSSEDSSLSAGYFTPVNPFTTRTLDSCNHVTTHVSNGKKTRVSTRWRAPSSGYGCVTISATVIQKGSIWFQNTGRLSLEICEAVKTTSPTSGNPECCACGSATYRMTFYGLWSPQTHPKDYPEYSTHWSNVVGASHSLRYSIWDYGELASPAVQKVAEWGWPNDVETEVRSQGDDVMSVIKTKAQWPAYEPRNIRSPPSDTFTVDRKHPLVSLLTMLGPSPDWNVGITKESMCTVECGWAGQRTYNLTPWDAGTDNGVSYMSPNSPTVPHESIRPLTTSDHPESPFYNPNGGPIRPVAKVVINRISLEGESCGQNEELPIDSDFDVTVASSSESNDVQPCMYSPWGDWSNCGVTCGWGIKTRSRMVKAQTGATACEATMAKEICKGSGTCENSNEVTVCIYSDWATWSSCGVTCGNATQFRSRVLQWPSEERYCHEPLKEMTSCALEQCPTQQDCQYSPWSRWMPCSVTCGFGQTLRKRFIVSHVGDESHCTKPLMQNSECLRSMTCEERSAEPDSSDCTYSPWTDWSACPVTCGVGQASRKRMLVSSSNTTTSCRDFEMENSKCMTSASCLDEDEQLSAPTCSYSDWSEWMPCTVSCGTGATLRKKFLLGSNANGICDGILMEQTLCYKAPCDVSTTSECVYASWSPWMPCSVTCGKGETLRKRFLNGDANPESCEAFQMETNICMMTCAVDTPSPCEYADWSPWMPCNAPCGQSGETLRKKMLTSASTECDAVVMETKSCVSPPCPEAQCVLQAWQPWSRCSTTCGSRGTKTRLRFPANGTAMVNCDATKLSEKARCRNPRCGRACVLSEWGSWTVCGVTCKAGKLYGYQIRRRRVLTRPRGRGRRCGPRKEKKKCLCPTIAT